jgi:hypothetical protein
MATKLLFISIGYLGLFLRAIYDLKQIECCFFMQWLQTEISFSSCISPVNRILLVPPTRDCTVAEGWLLLTAINLNGQ